MQQKDIAIVGMSIYCPAGDSLDEFWHNLINGMDAITDAPHELIDSYYFGREEGAIDSFYCSRGGFCKPYKVDPLRYGFVPITFDGMETEQVYALAGVEQALIDAGIFEKGISLNNCSIIIGRGNFSGNIALRAAEVIRTGHQLDQLLRYACPDIPEDEITQIKKEYQKQCGRFQSDTAIGTMPSLAASQVANRFDMHGPAYTVDAACASGIVAINHSIALLQSGQCDVTVAGGMHLIHNAMFWGAFNMMGAVSHKQQISPFSEDADGLLIGQGAGFVVLKTLDRAIEDGDKIYAVIKGTAISSDGRGSHVMVTSVHGQLRVLDEAWKASGLDPSRIGYVEAHGTGTIVGDRTEISTMTQFFGDASKDKAFVGSVKSNIGHTMPAAGMIGLIKTALALYHRKIPPTLHCDKPLAAMEESRFKPPQQLVEWDSDKYPLVAGVNSFGFGGVNSHAVLTAYEQPVGRSPRPFAYHGEAAVLSAKTKEQLLAKLDDGDFTNTGGDCRMVIFNPTPQRIKQAKNIVNSGAPWYGRLDMWFSSEPLLSGGGKIAFMYPGFVMDAEFETASLTDYFGLEKAEFEEGKNYDGVRPYYVMLVSNMVLNAFGIEPDMYAGHSIGEWQATKIAGMVDDDLSRVVFEGIGEYSNTKGRPLYYIAVSNTAYSKIEQWCAEIDGLYMANDNCPDQVVLCADQPAKDTLIAILEEDKIHHYMLPFIAGFHTPYMEDYVGISNEAIKDLAIKPPKKPVWLSTLKAPVSDDQEEFKTAMTRQLVKPVYFRGMIERMYEEADARVFIQIGHGNLVGFVDNILKGKEYASMATCATNRTGVDQFRHLLALLYVCGKDDIDYKFLGVKPQYMVEHSVVPLATSPGIVKEFPLLKEAIKKYYRPASGGGAEMASLLDYENADNPFIQAVNENIMDAVNVQRELVGLFGELRPAPGAVPAGGAAAVRGRIPARPSARVAAAAAGAAPAPQQAQAPAKAQAPVPAQARQMKDGKKGYKFNDVMRLKFDDHPYLIDHAIVRQPADWPIRGDLNPVVPFTLMLELLAERALSHAGGRKLVKISSSMAMKWITVEKPFEAQITGEWKSDDTLALAIVGHASANFHFADEYPEPPKESDLELDIGEMIMEPLSSDEAYDKYAFHGPCYHSVQAYSNISDRGIYATAEKQSGRGSLLDSLGQIIGLYLHVTQDYNTISFPIRVNNINFYDDIFDQKGVFDVKVIIRSRTESLVVGDMVMSRGGRVWMNTDGWINQRFENNQAMWNAIIKPQFNTIANMVAPHVCSYYDVYEKNYSWILLYGRYLNGPERRHYDSLIGKRNRLPYLISRIAMKDAVRTHLRSAEGSYPYPIEIAVEHDENGKPYLGGEGELGERLKNLHVSVAHKGMEAIAISMDRPVGIDLEAIETRDSSFMELAFTEKERAMLADMGPDRLDEWATRFWVAKEAYSKMLGTGLQGNPKRFEIGAVMDEEIVIGDTAIKTIIFKEGLVAGWTK
ncbi:MAG: 4'-phosphopantetheinyl transferase superfamily protein [Clostridiales Family XIII bacterium]|jgi:3-oxoacyl-(acyl-carrier-protein) synthase/phosphopantetheinyl transferase/malonyl CoA-acyl carrier protein transacylase|nr:4'-phosphopantetheinyl transferase superfamily protein [Clostridiales Family XIII bacterium]